MRRTATAQALWAIIAGGLLASHDVLQGLIGMPPADAAALAVWMEAKAPLFAAANELLMLSTLALVPVIVGMAARSLRRRSLVLGTASVLLVLVAALRLVLVVVQGRLVYPAAGMPPSQGAHAVLMLTVYGGGRHTAGLIVGVAMVLVGSVLGGRGRRLAGPAAIAAGLLYSAGSLAWLPLSPAAAAAFRAVTALWLIAAGVLALRPGGGGAAGGSAAN